MRAGATDEFAHPASEKELVQLVKRAADEKKKLRVEGAGHSVKDAIFPTVDPPGGIIKVKLDHYAGWYVRDEAERIVVAEAGIHLGADPSDPLAPLEKSLLYQLWDKHRWTLSELGGITHQTVSGFTATASAGGSIKYSFEDNLYGFRVIDGRGRVTEITRYHPHYWAMVPNMGLLGVVSAVIFKCVECFDIVGSESVTTVDGCPIDVLGRDVQGGKPSLETFLRETDFARIEWWPQPGVERIAVWQAGRVSYDSGRRCRPYLRFGRHPTRSQIGIALFYTVLGNTGDGEGKLVRIKLPAVYAAIRRTTNRFLTFAIAVVTSSLIFILDVGSRRFAKRVPRLFPRLLGLFLHLDDHRRGRRRGEPAWFTDDSWRGLPMDNVLSDDLVPVQFTEIYVPLRYATCLVQRMDAYFKGNDNDPASVYDRTGLFAFELYAAKASSSWLSPTSSDGNDEWAEGAFRFNAYWFMNNALPATEGTLRGIWDEMYKSKIPFRLHWGKVHPSHEPPAERSWIELLSAEYPDWQRFLALRRYSDPDELFLTPYWCERLGIRPQAGATGRAAGGVAGCDPALSQ